MTRKRKGRQWFPLIEQYGSPLPHVTDAPQTVTEIYFKWTGQEPRRSLTRRMRNERRWLAKHLEFFANEGRLNRDISGNNFIRFCTPPVAADAAGSHQPGGAARLRADGRSD